jgi:hypothetical protein
LIDYLIDTADDFSTLMGVRTINSNGRHRQVMLSDWWQRQLQTQTVGTLS